jgi:hypothetical protein
MKIMNNMLSKGVLLLFLLMLSVVGSAQSFSLALTNQSSTSTTFDVDVMITLTAPTRLASVSTGIFYNSAILNGGAPCTANNCGSWSLVPNSRASELSALLGYTLAVRTTAPFVLRITQINQAGASSPDLAAGTYRIGTFRFTNTVPWTASSNAQLYFQSAVQGGGQNSIIGWFPFGASTPITNTVTGASLSLSHSSAAAFYSVPLNFPTNTCATSGVASNLGAVTCFGGNNGSATVTMSPVPSNTSVTYSVDGGTPIPATLVAGAFNVSGLTAGSHSIVVTNPSCSNVTVPVTITGPSGPLTNTTPQTSCDSFTWSVNGQTYTEGGTYTGTTTNGNGCTVNETLVLTINNSPAHTTTTSACDTFTWAAPLGNGQTYTESTTVSNSSTNASGCSHVETLVLTINHSSTSTDTQSACNSYTWPANNQTYTASGTYTATTTNASGCPNVATLVLTINTATTAYYADADNDGFGAGTAIFSCEGQPAGTVTNNTDCAPNDPLKWRSINLYVDADGDGYYNGNPETTAVCYGATVPSGYTATIIGTDCDDANAEANPNHVEIAGNSIDDNCDGTIDETGPAIGLVASQCGTTLANVAATIYANQAAGAQGYRFEVTNGSNVRTYDSATSSFSLMSLAGGVTYGTTYSIRVAVKTNGFWRSYSASCSITTPAAPATTNVIASTCGTTLSNIANLIYANQVTAANQYRFEVTDIANTSNVRTYDSAVNRFALSNLAGGGAYGATYSIRVALRFGTTWEPYGTSCNVSTPSAPGVTSLIASQCGVVVTNRWVTLYANQVSDAQGYRFEVVNGATTRFYDTTVNRFALGNLAGGVTANTVYTVRVAVLYNSVYGSFGSACTVTTSGAFTRTSQDADSVFVVKSYPNPFADTFRLDINTSSDSGVELKVYDMIGKLVESRQVSISEMGSVELGSRYSSGVYNVIVAQGGNVQTLRVIKR